MEPAERVGPVEPIDSPVGNNVVTFLGISEWSCFLFDYNLTVSQMYKYLLFFIKYENSSTKPLTYIIGHLKLALLLTRGPLQKSL